MPRRCPTCDAFTLEKGWGDQTTSAGGRLGVPYQRWHCTTCSHRATLYSAPAMGLLAVLAPPFVAYAVYALVQSDPTFFDPTPAVPGGLPNRYTESTVFMSLVLGIPAWLWSWWALSSLWRHRKQP